MISRKTEIDREDKDTAMIYYFRKEALKVLFSPNSENTRPCNNEKRKRKDNDQI